LAELLTEICKTALAVIFANRADRFYR